VLSDEIAYEKVKALQRLKVELLGGEPTEAQLEAIGKGLRVIYNAIGWKHPTKGWQSQ
jgi:hypothetical protein